MIIFICTVQSTHMLSNIEAYKRTLNKKRKVTNQASHKAAQRQRAKQAQHNMQEQPPSAHQQLQSIQKDIEVMKQQVMLNLQQPVGNRDMSIIPKIMQKIYSNLFKKLQVQETEEDRIALARKSPFLHIDQRFNQYRPEVIKALADMSYIWFVYHTIQKNDSTVNPDSLFLPPDVTLIVNGQTHTYSARDWALSMQKAGFNHPNQLRAEVTDATMQLMKPNGTFEAINTALHYGSYIMTKATELAWFYAPETVFGVPQDLVNLQYESNPYQVYADKAATYHDYIEPAAMHTWHYIRNPRQAYQDAINLYHEHIKPTASMLHEHTQAATAILRRKIFGNEPPAATAQPKTVTPEIARPEAPL